jgi:hypothetical protein
MSRGNTLLLFKNAPNDRETPDWLVQQLSQQHGPFDCDPCPLNNNTAQWNALTAPRWGRNNFVNPPFDNIEPFIKKALELRDKHGTKSTFIVPLRPTSLYWRRYVWNEASSIGIFQDRVRFAGFKRKLNVPLAVVVFGDGKKMHKKRRYVATKRMPVYTIV